MTNHTHTWKAEVFRYQADYLPALRTGNFICSCGEKLWEDEVLDVINLNTSYGIRGSGNSKKPTLNISREKWIELATKIVHFSEDWEEDDDGDEYPVQRLNLEETAYNLEELIIDLLKGKLP